MHYSIIALLQVNVIMPPWLYTEATVYRLGEWFTISTPWLRNIQQFKGKIIITNILYSPYKFDIIYTFQLLCHNIISKGRLQNRGNDNYRTFMQIKKNQGNVHMFTLLPLIYEIRLVYTAIDKMVIALADGVRLHG